MNQSVLIIGGCGGIGSSIAGDLRQHTQAHLILTSRRNNLQVSLPDSQFLQLELGDRDAVKQAIQDCDLVIHCAGPFDYRDAFVLKSCIELGVNYLDVSDRPPFVQKALTYREAAQQAGITAILSTGVFPGISNSMVRLGVEQLDRVDKIEMYYLVAGSGGAGVTVMRTTFLGLQNPFKVWMEGKWQTVKPYSDRVLINFPKPYSNIGVYWFEVPETYSFVESFPDVKTVITKFGSFPDFYNLLTWLTARFAPKVWLKKNIEFLSQTAYRMTELSDRFSGIGVAMEAKITGWKGDTATTTLRERAAISRVGFLHPNTAMAAGYGTGSLAKLLLEGTVQKPGVWSVEQALPTDLFQREMAVRNVTIESNLLLL